MPGLDEKGLEEVVDEDRKYLQYYTTCKLFIFRQISAGSNDGTTGTSAISGGVSSDGSHTSEISNKDTPSGQSTSETSGAKPGRSGISESGISDLTAKTDGVTGMTGLISKMTGPSELSGEKSVDIRTTVEQNQKDELKQFYDKYFETDPDTGGPKIPDYEKLGRFSVLCQRCLIPSFAANAVQTRIKMHSRQTKEFFQF